MNMSVEEDEVPTLIEHPEEDNTETAPPRRVPLTIITGFLGAGKSTLLKRILTERHGYRIAVILNEFGDTAEIEARTIDVSQPTADGQGSTNTQLLALPNGCLCCTIRHPSVASIEALMSQAEFDYVLLETSGLADVTQVASMFWANEEFSAVEEGLGGGGVAGIVLDGVVCVVDAVFGAKQMQEDHEKSGIPESLRQIAAADLLLLNKSDLAKPADLTALEHTLHTLNPGADVLRTVRGTGANCEDVVGRIFGGGGFRAARTHARLPRTPEEDGHVHSNACGDSCEKGHLEVRGVSALTLPSPLLDEAALARVDAWVREVLWEGRVPPSQESGAVTVLRLKGLLYGKGGETWLVHGVRDLYEITKIDDEGEGRGDRDGKLVLIGSRLGPHVRQSWEAAMAS